MGCGASNTSDTVKTTQTSTTNLQQKSNYNNNTKQQYQHEYNQHNQQVVGYHEADDIHTPTNDGQVDKFDPNLPTYTIRELAEYNKKLGHLELFRYHQMVCSSQRFKQVIERPVREFEDSIDTDDYEPYNFNEDFEGYPIFNIWCYVGMKVNKITPYLRQCKVAQFKQLSDQEELADLKSDANGVYQALQGDSISEYQQEYKDLLSRFLVKTLQLQRYGLEEGDPNQKPFPLPSDILGNIKVLRFWIETWEAFDFEVPEGGSWNMTEANLVFNGIDEEVQPDEEEEDLPELNFEIDGEAAWNVLELDIVKNDVTTDEQNRIWELREKRSDMNDPARMKRRREKIEKYFILKYEWPESKLGPYRGFVTLLQSHWEEFQLLQSQWEEIQKLRCGGHVHIGALFYTQDTNSNARVQSDRK